MLELDYEMRETDEKLAQKMKQWLKGSPEDGSDDDYNEKDDGEGKSFAH